ncbi:MAG: glycine zipper domain-containing protein [Chthoniobacterales bacterium]
MKKQTFGITALLGLAALSLTSCETATGTGALVGAATGAAIGGSSYHHSGERALAGAAIGAGAGALVGAAIDANRAAEYGPAPEGGYPVASWSGTPGLVVSPYPPHRLVDVRGIPHGSLVRDPASGGVFRRP